LSENLLGFASSKPAKTLSFSSYDVNVLKV
jgi:hypothetical protein